MTNKDDESDAAPGTARAQWRQSRHLSDGARAGGGGGGGGARPPFASSLPRAHASRHASLGCRYLASAHIVDEDGEATRALLGARAARASAMAAAGG